MMSSGVKTFSQDQQFGSSFLLPSCVCLCRSSHLFCLGHYNSVDRILSCACVLVCGGLVLSREHETWRLGMLCLLYVQSTCVVYIGGRNAPPL